MKNQPKHLNQIELKELLQEVYEANIKLYKSNLAILTWGNVSKINKNRTYMVIKPSGLPYEKMTYLDMVVVDLNGNVLTDNIKPSSDTPTHLLLYKEYNEIESIVHTHSPYAVAFAQAGKDIPCYGTTHADNFYGSVPCVRDLTETEIMTNYEHNTGAVIVSEFKKRNISPRYINACLVKEHGPFVWSYKNASHAVDIASTLEEVAKMAILTTLVEKNAPEVKQAIKDKHYNRKHGKNAYYGQN